MAHIALMLYGIVAVFQMPLQDNYVFWKIVGFTGILTFGSRFIVQWIYSEKLGESRIPPAFWWQSLVASLLCLAYFLRQKDSVGILGYAVNIIPYVRNIMLINKQQKKRIGSAAPAETETAAPSVG
jgi:lipid-A-disaccharide synthase-like uncharacterized protein